MHVSERERESKSISGFISILRIFFLFSCVYKTLLPLKNHLKINLVLFNYENLLERLRLSTGIGKEWEGKKEGREGEGVPWKG